MSFEESCMSFSIAIFIDTISVQDKNLKRLEEEGLMEITTNQSIPHESD